MKQLTLRQIPDAVEEKLRQKAAREHQSLNRTAIDALAKGLGVERQEVVKRDLSNLAGRWSKQESAEFERNIAIFETIDDELWRQ